ncbi:MAG TPA: hypothetical protein PK264_24270 [Hyphomicrobiaceae bacterium]|nr:hypothetical protein [Hyphomicrobiaceae bacterium]
MLLSTAAIAGIAAAAGLAAGRRPAGTIGWPLALVWALVQIPVYTTVESGWINQTALRFPLALTYSLRENNQLVSHLQAGVNLAALAYAVMLSRRRQEIASPYAARHSAGGSRSAGRSRIEREASR